MSDKRTLIAKGKIASITASSQVAINAGIDKGVKEGDIVVLHKSVDVKDPETGEFLGSILYPRLNLKVNLVAQKFSIAITTDRFTDVWSKGNNIKTVTLDPKEESDGVVLVAVGEEVSIYRNQDEPPF